MAILGKLLHRKPEDEVQEIPQDDTQAEPQTCPHVSLLPRWDNVDDIGHEDRATSWICSACEQGFTSQEVLDLRRTQHDRLQQVVTPNSDPEMN